MYKQDTESGTIMNNTKKSGMRDLTTGSVPKNIIAFAAPLFFGQLLQTLYNMVDAWVIGNFTDTDTFAAISSTFTIVFLILGFFGGIAQGGSILISHFFGAKDYDNVSRAIHTNFLMAIMASVISTAGGLVLTPHIIAWIGVPESVAPHSIAYLSIFFAGVSTVIIYNTGMAIMRALGDSLHPLYYLIFSSILNVGLDLLFVAHPSFRWGISGAAIATVISQGVSAVLCLIRLVRLPGFAGLHLSKLRFYPHLMAEVLHLGLPSGIQNSVLTIGNLVVQKNINSFGKYAMSGYGAYSRIESLVFLPITCMAMGIATFVSQNLGSKKYGRAKKGARFSIIVSMVSAELIGLAMYFFSPKLISIFTQDPYSIEFGVTHARITCWFLCLLALAHCSAGVMRGCGRAVVPMVNMLSFWCIVRIIYVTIATRIVPEYATIAWAYPLTWGLSDIVFVYFLLRTDWVHAFEKEQ